MDKIAAKIWYPFLSILAFLVMVGMFVISALSATGPDGTLFIRDQSEQSDKYETLITPSSWAFTIWTFIYIWQGLWQLYSVVNIFRKGPKGPAYAQPVFLPSYLFGLSILASFSNVAWLIIFDRDEVIASFVVLIFYSLFLGSALGVSSYALDKASPRLADQGRSHDIWLTRALVHNSFGLQGSWVIVATMLNATIVMTYEGDPSVDMKAAATVSLSILSGILLIYAALDIFVLDRYTRYTITPYIPIIVAMVGGITKRWVHDSRISIYTAVVLTVASVLLAIKLVLMVYRTLTRPSYHTKYDLTNDVISYVV